MSHYDTNDEYDVAQGIFDALSATRPMPGTEWLGWKISEPSLGEIEVEVPEGQRYRIVVEPIDQPD